MCSFQNSHEFHGSTPGNLGILAATSRRCHIFLGSLNSERFAPIFSCISQMRRDS